MNKSWAVIFSLLYGAGGTSTALTVENGEVFYSQETIVISPNSDIGNSLLVASGGKMMALSGVVLDNNRSYNFSRADVTGPESLLHAGSSVGVYGWGSRVNITAGGVVRCPSFGIYGDTTYGIVYSDLLNQVFVSGSGSQLYVTNNLNIWSPDSPGAPGLPFDLPREIPSSVSVSGGGEVSAGSLSVANKSWFGLGSGGTLTVRSDFNASQAGFNYGQGGTLAVGGQLSGLLSLNTGRRLEAGNILGDMTVHGTFAPGNSPADSTVTGALTIAADGTLELELAGYELGSGYDRLTVTGHATLDGTLDIVFLDGFMAEYGDSFDLFNWDGGVSGEFASIDSSALSGGLYWDTSELYATGTLSVIPEPGTIGMMGLSSGFLLFTRNLRRRRKAGLSLLPIRSKYDDGMTFDTPVHDLSAEHSGTTIDLAGMIAPRLSTLAQRMDSWRKSSSNRFWDSLIAWDGIMDAIKQKTGACFDAILALVMK